MTIVRTVKKVVVLGGGPAGRSVLESLYKVSKKEKKVRLEVLMVNRVEYGENTPLAVRAWLVHAEANTLGQSLQVL